MSDKINGKERKYTSVLNTHYEPNDRKYIFTILLSTRLRIVELVKYYF